MQGNQYTDKWGIEPHETIPLKNQRIELVTSQSDSLSTVAKALNP